MGAIKVQMKSRHLVHMTSEIDLEVNMAALPAEPRRSRGELFLSQLSALEPIHTWKWTQTKRDVPAVNTPFMHWSICLLP